MKIPTNIDFKDLSEVQYFHEGSPEYNALKKINDDGVWKDYCNELLSTGISSRYDVTSDMFIIKPVAFRAQNLKEGIEFEDDIVDIEDDDLSAIEDDDIVDIEDDDLSAIEDDDEEEEILEPEIQDETNNQMKEVTLDDVMALIKSIIPNSGTTDPLSTDKGSLSASSEDLKKTYSQSTGNGTLNSEFSEIDANLDTFMDHAEDETYINQLGYTLNPVEYDGITNPADVNGQLGFDDVDSFSTDVSAFDYEPDEDCIGNRCTPSLETAGSFKNVSDDFYNKSVDTEYDPTGGEDELLLDDESYMHPDIERIGGDLDFTEEDEFEDPIEYVEDEPVAKAPSTPAMNINKTVNMGGTPVQIVLTGVMITPTELNYIGESVSKTGNKLKAIKGNGKRLEIVLESGNKQYTIKYEDNPSYIEPLPFSIKKFKFKSLQESLDRINYSIEERQTEIFKSIIQEDISEREINNFEESDILALNENIKYISNWNVQNIGTVNLKNCLNEKYSDITKIGSEPNTLIKNENGQYLLIKGNLRERSKVGVKRELVESTTKRRVNYGICEVVGVYDNTAEGLGEVMYVTKKGSIPLLVWK